MKTLFIPLDERPCNYNFPLMIAQSNQQIELVEPDKSFLGHKKKQIGRASCRERV